MFRFPRPRMASVYAFLSISILALAAFIFGPSQRTIEASRLQSEDAHARSRISEMYGRLPLSFEANQGQADAEVKFVSRGAGYQLYLTGNEATLALERNDAANDMSVAAQGAVLRLRLVAAEKNPQVVGLNQLPGKTNYFIGSKQEDWRTNVPSFERVEFKDVYPGVNVAYYGNQRQLEYDFIVAPGAKTEQIKLSFEGAEQVRIDERGELVLSTAGGEVRQHKPVVYQESDGARKEIASRYVLTGENEVGFVLGDYDRSKTLVIDPVLVYSTYLGGLGTDQALAIAVDATGHVYVSGITLSNNFPTVNALQGAAGGTTASFDAFVAKLNPAGTALVYSTYLGGNLNDRGHSIAVDAAGNAYVTGMTSSANFPTANAWQPNLRGTSDAFIAKLNPAGTALVYSTYLGGVSVDQANGVAVDAGGNAYLAGMTGSSNFPTLSPLQANRHGNVFFKSNDGGDQWNAFDTGLQSGIINSLAVNPANPSIVYAATDSGVYKSTDGGGSWAGAGLDQLNAFINELALDPTNPSTLYAATNSSGVYKSTDGGVNWSQSNTGLTASAVLSLAINPTSPNYIYAGTRLGGIFRSSDGGANWIASSTGLPGTVSSVPVIVIHPANPVIMYAGTNRGVYRSDNAGTSWSAPISLTTSTINDIAVDRINSSTLYAAASLGFYKSTNGGVNWTMIEAATNYYAANAIVIDPNSPLTMYVATSGAGVVKSTDGGAVWTTIANGLPNRTVYALALNPLNTSVIHAGALAGSDGFLTKLNPSGTPLFSTYLGGTLNEAANAIALDSQGNAYVAGQTESTNFPLVNPVQSTNVGVTGGFVTKFNAAGSALVYSTYLGGSEYDVATGIAVDAAGNAYVAGETYSTDFPTANPLQATCVNCENFATDAFVSKLSPGGNAFVYSTYLGGADSDGATGIAVDAGGNAFVTGYTNSFNFPTIDPAQGVTGGPIDAFVTKLNASGSSLLYSTYLGGLASERANGIAVDSSNNAYVTGYTNALNFPTANALQATSGGGTDAFIAKLGISVDLSIAKLDSRDPVMVNNNFSYTITARNNGPSPATGVTVTDALPSGLMFVSASSTQGTCSGTSTITCNIGALAVNASAIVTITVTPTAAGTISNTATVTANEPEQNQANNSANATTNISLLPSITGRILDAGNNGLSNVTVTLSGTQSLVTQTDANGNYQFNNLTQGGSFTVTPSKQDYTFTPPAYSFNNLQQDQTANFGAMVCSYSISPAGQSIASSGGNGSVSVNATGDCPWTATSNASWITITSGASGNGNGVVNFTVAPTTAPRSGTLTIAGRTFIVWQEFSSCAALSLSGARNYAVLSTPNIMAAADFNHDGKKDIVTLTTGSYVNVSVLLNNGTGGFGPPRPNQTLPSTPQHLTLAHVNTTDNNIDLIVTDGISVQIMYGNGDGDFGSHVRFTVGTQSHYSTVAGDFNQDGKTDLAVWYRGGSTDNAVSILLGNGLGGFGSPVATFDGMSPSIGDFNRDNKPDVAVFNGGNLSVRMGDGAGNFGAPVNTAMSNVYRPEFHDLNGDGNLDFLNETYIAFGNGAGGFASPIPFSFGPQSPRRITAGDFDGDAKTDLVGLVGEFNLIILRGDGLGNFGQPTTYLVGREPISLLVTDFNNDNKLDLASGSYYGNSVSVLFNYCGSDPGINIGGQVTTNAGVGVQGATVKLVSSQLGTFTRTTDASGNYSFDNLPRNDIYTISVNQLGGLNFTPQTITNPQVNQTVNFMSGPLAYRIFGRVQQANGQPMPGAQVFLSGPQSASVISDSNGDFVFGPLIPQTYTVTALETAIFTYAVSSVNVTLTNQDRFIYFTATRQNYTVHAYVLDSAGQPIGGVPLIMKGGAFKVASTLSSGMATFANVPAGYDYTITPWSALYSFSPVKVSYTSLQSHASVTFTVGPRRTVCDFDRDGKTDISLFRPSSGSWYISNSSDGSFRAEHFGASGDQPMPGDYDGDGHTDLAVFRQANGYWYIMDSSTNTFRAQAWGQSGDIAAAGDFDGDGVTDIAVFRPSTGAWYLLQSYEGFVAHQFGASGDVPVVGDYDFDGRKDIGVFRPSTGSWYIQRSSLGLLAQQFGITGDQPVTGDFDGDNKADLAVFRPSDGNWYIQQSAAGFRAEGFGTSGDIAAAGDYDGDAKADLAVFRPSNGSWYILRSSNGALMSQQFGLAGDVPAPAVYLPQ
jgi:uncharacterized repeat protein (TIGR01451 family)